MREARRTLLVAVAVSIGAACGGGDEEAVAGGGNSSTTGPEPSAATTTGDPHRAAIARGELPDLTGATDLNELGDETGVLYELHDLIGLQETIRVPSDEASEGAVVAQHPPPGTPLDDIGQWSLTVSEGGPAVTFDELPTDVATFALTLDGLDDQSLFVERVADSGTVYKHDDWLIGLDCDAVEAAYRTFLDGRYDTACPGWVNAPPAGVQDGSW